MGNERIQLWKSVRRRLAALLACALIFGMLPVPAAPLHAQNTYVDCDLRNPVTVNGVTTWDTVFFGSYWQNDVNGDGTTDQNDGKSPIQWRVLSVDGDDAFLLAERNLDCQPYNEKWEIVTWETCSLRSWLNDTFLNNAFTEAERSVILTTLVENPDNPQYTSEGERIQKEDQVYLLSIDEALKSEYGFSNDFSAHDKGRQAINTQYAKEQGAETDKSGAYGGNGAWWLRTPSTKNILASDVHVNGIVDMYGYGVDTDDYLAVRPVLHLDLSSDSSWSYAGTVNSEGVFCTPSPSPTEAATQTTKPTKEPTEKPGVSPETTPTAKPTKEPTEKPTVSPEATPTIKPTKKPTISPTKEPTEKPTEQPEATPTRKPTKEPTEQPSAAPGNPTTKPNDNMHTPPPGSVPNQSGGNQSSASSSADGNEENGYGDPSSLPKAGTIFTVSGIRYKIKSVSGKKKTVVLLKAIRKKMKKVTIPNTVKYKSVTYQVVEISKNAFKGCRRLTKVTVGKRVKVIGKRAFSGCKKIKIVTIRSKLLKKIGKGAFAGISRKAKIKIPRSRVKKYRKFLKRAGWRG